MDGIESILVGDNLSLKRQISLYQKMLEIINNYSKVAGYNTNIQKSVAFLYTNSKISEREIKKAIPFKIASKK